jgi:hypothetical protein
VKIKCGASEGDTKPSSSFTFGLGSGATGFAALSGTGASWFVKPANNNTENQPASTVFGSGATGFAALTGSSSWLIKPAEGAPSSFLKAPTSLEVGSILGAPGKQTKPAAFVFNLPPSGTSNFAFG